MTNGDATYIDLLDQLTELTAQLNGHVTKEYYYMDAEKRYKLSRGLDLLFQNYIQTAPDSSDEDRYFIDAVSNFKIDILLEPRQDTPG